MNALKQQYRALFALISFLQAATFFAFMLALMFFAHLHVAPGGYIVVHSHAVPAQHGNEAPHKHSRFQLAAHQLSSHSLSAFFIVLFAALGLVILALLQHHETAIKSFQRIRFFVNRAPPILAS